MKKTVYILAVMVILAGILVAGCGGSTSDSSAPVTDPESAATTPAQPGKVHELTFATFQPETNAITGINTELMREIEQRTDGRVKIVVHAGGSLLNAQSMYQGILDGVTDIGYSLNIYEPGGLPFCEIANIPAAAQSAWVQTNAFRDFMIEYKPKEWDNFHVLTTVVSNSVFYAIGSCKKEIRTIEDWAGHSFRVGNPEVVQAFGGTVKDIPMADLYDALNKGVVDGVVTSLEAIKGWKLGEVLKYLTINTTPAEWSSVGYIAVNKKTWDSLPTDIQEIIDQVSQEYHNKMAIVWDDQQVEAVEFYLSLGKSPYMLPDDEAERWLEQVLPVVDRGLKNMIAAGLPEDEVRAAWTFYQERIDYWNEQQSSNNIVPTLDRIRGLVEGEG